MSEELAKKKNTMSEEGKKKKLKYCSLLKMIIILFKILNYAIN